MPYSNVTPPALPAFDTAAYPNYVLVFNYSEGGTDWNQVHLMYCTTPFTYNGYVTNADATHGWRVAGKDGEWSAEVFEETKLTLKPGLNGEVYQRIYTNHDILDSSGKVWLAADSVTPVEDNRDLRTYSLGIALALIQEALAPIKAKQPTAYLYNGVKLPALPEWDREAYPYAYIYTFTNGNYYLEFETSTHVALSSGRCWVGNSDTAYKLVDGAWEKASLGNYFTMIWSNTDVYYGDSVEEVGGTIYLEASEPVPVYE